MTPSFAEFSARYPSGHGLAGFTPERWWIADMGGRDKHSLGAGIFGHADRWRSIQLGFHRRRASRGLHDLGLVCQPQ